MIPLPWSDDTVITIWELENIGVECGPRFREAVFNTGDTLKEQCLHETTGHVAITKRHVADAEDTAAFTQGSNLGVSREWFIHEKFVIKSFTARARVFSLLSPSPHGATVSVKLGYGKRNLTPQCIIPTGVAKSLRPRIWPPLPSAYQTFSS